MMLKQFGKYKLLELLGSGATSDVYRARDTVLGREVALKVLKPALVPDPSAFGRFVRGAQVAAGLFHPNIATVLDIGEANGNYFIALQYIPGKSLDKLLQKNGPLSWEETLRMARQIGAALDSAHKQGFLHRDVKPGNILHTPEGNFVLTDFGLTRAMMSTGLTSHTGAILGTPAYIAPEVWDGQEAGPATDQYALACVIFEALTGEVLYAGNTPPAVMAKHFQPPQFSEDSLKKGPPRLADALRKALAMKPEERYQSIEEFATALEKVVATEAGKGVEGKRKKEEDRSKQKERMRDVPTPPVEHPLFSVKWARWAAIIGLVVLVGMGVFLGNGFLNQRQERSTPLVEPTTNRSTFPNSNVTETSLPTEAPIPTFPSIKTNPPTDAETPVLTPTLAITPTLQGIWSVVSDPITENLNSVSMVSATDGWAVGNNGTFLCWNGKKWTNVSGPSTNALLAVAMASPTNGWATDIGGSNKGNILHWNGTNWSKYLTDNPFLDALSIISDSNGSSVYSAGWWGSIWHLNGSTWFNQNSTNLVMFFGIGMLSDTNGWAVGGLEGQAEDTGLIFHWDGNSWRKVAGPVTGYYYNAIAAEASDNVWIVGNHGTILHWDGNSWNQVVSPVTSPLNAISMVSANDGWSIGGGGGWDNRGSDSGVILHWNGASWTQIPSPSKNSLNSIAMVSASDGWIVGDGVILRFGPTPTPTNTPTVMLTP